MTVQQDDLHYRLMIFITQPWRLSHQEMIPSEGISVAVNCLLIDGLKCITSFI